MDLSIIMTVHDREPEILVNSLRWLSIGAFKDAEVIIVDDRSSMSYDWVMEYGKYRFSEFKWVKTGDYDGFRLEHGYGNPSRAFNVGLLEATRANLGLMSSDVLVTKKASISLSSSLKFNLPITPRVLDLESNAEYCGPTRFFPMPWFLIVPRNIALDIGGWDEAYLDGISFEDNDFVGRVGLKCGKILADWDSIIYHQSHYQPAYIPTPDLVEAHEKNRRLTMNKWKGIPFDKEKTPFDVTRKYDPNGFYSMVFTEGSGLLDRAVSLTKGIVKERGNNGDL